MVFLGLMNKQTNVYNKVYLLFRLLLSTENCYKVKTSGQIHGYTPVNCSLGRQCLELESTLQVPLLLLAKISPVRNYY